jgi:ABC-type glycerol-3-phosphate transport system permease component
MNVPGLLSDHPRVRNRRLPALFYSEKFWKRMRLALLIVILLFVTVVFVLPYLWMFMNSFKPSEDVFKYSYPLTWKTFIPPVPTLANYLKIFAPPNDFQFKMLNSLIVAICQLVGTLIFCAPAAYVLSRMKFRGRDFLFGLILLVAFVPFEVNMVPLYIVVRSLNLQNSYGAVFLPFIASPFGVFLLRQSFMEIPVDYDEAAQMEGASRLQILWHVILPNAKPTLITLALMSFLNAWNAFFWPLIVIQDPNKQLVQVAVATFTLPTQLPAWGEIFATSTMATIPVLILFLFLQKYYIRGVVMSGIKG